MSDHSRTVHDPFLGTDVQVSNRLTDRLRGRYACGPTMPNGEPEFGWREFGVPPIQREAAARIEKLEAALQELINGVGGHGHWDPKGTHGANCPLCERQFAAKERARAVLREDK